VSRGPAKARRSAAWRDGWWPAACRLESPNADDRAEGAKVELVVVHSISLPPGEYGGDDVCAFFTNRLDHDAHPYFERLRGLRVSAHFLVRRDGAVVQFVSCDRRAWHAGVSAWRARAACNDFSIGIELEGLEGTPFDVAQYEALARLLRALGRRYPIQAILGHEHVAPGRKHDPGCAFDWGALARLTRAPARWWRDLRDAKAGQSI
jgi:AmpD protein